MDMPLGISESIRENLCSQAYKAMNWVRISLQVRGLNPTVWYR